MGKTKIQIVDESREKEKPKKERRKRSLKEEKGVRVPGLKGGERVVAVSGEPIKEDVAKVEKVEKVEKAKEKKQKQRGKKYLTAQTKIDPQKSYSYEDAARLVKETSISRFPGSVELHLVLAKGNLNTSVELPYSTGKTRKIEIANEETIEKLKEGKVDFDVLLATPGMMPKLVPFAKLLGPRGLLPNPKQGTLVPDPEKAKEKFGGKSLQIKSEKNAPLVHLVVAKISQPEEEIAANIKAIIKSIEPKNIQKAVVSASMGPGIKVTID